MHDCFAQKRTFSLVEYFQARQGVSAGNAACTKRNSTRVGVGLTCKYQTRLKMMTKTQISWSVYTLQAGVFSSGASTFQALPSWIDLLAIIRPGANVIKLFCPWFTDFRAKLECLLD
jgi:hypothetical protein